MDAALTAGRVCVCLLLYHPESQSAGPSLGRRQKTGTGKGDGMSYWFRKILLPV